MTERDCDVHFAESLFQTCSRACLRKAGNDNVIRKERGEPLWHMKFYP
ncbi:DUF6783 domain-containing protein [Blautia sp.]